MKRLLAITAAIEAGTGIGLLVAPPVISQLLLGATLDAPAAVTVARVAGAALLTLGVACWLARDDGRSMVLAMLFYNIVTAAVLAFAGLDLGLRGAALWPAVVIHTLMAVWCFFAGRRRRLPSMTIGSYLRR